MKILIGIAFLCILISLGAAGLFMLRRPDPEKPKNKSMVNALTLRIGISVALFLTILLLWSLGYIEPTGIIPGQQ
jgi:cytochrome b561